MRILIVILAVALNIIPGGKAFLKPLQQRDSILVADQLEYGFCLDSLSGSAAIALPDFSEVSNDTLTVVRNWQIDTVRRWKKKNMLSIRAYVTLAPFEEGIYHLPPVPVARMVGETIDTLIFDPQTMEVKTMPVDTATFQVHDLKGQISYPVTFMEVLPYILGLLLLAGLGVLVWWLLSRRQKKQEELLHKDPAHIVALRELDKYRGDKFWAPEKQKTFYSGVTDTLKVYIDDRFGVDAPEMTTAELFSALKKNQDLTPEMYSSLKDLFERADFVKFAKFTASQEENAAVLPLAVRFVTETYQAEIENEE